MALKIARKTWVAWPTGSVRPGAGGGGLPAMDAALRRSAPTYHGEKLDTGLGCLARLPFAPTTLSFGERFDHLALQYAVVRPRLQQCIEGGDELCPLRVSPTDVAKAHNFRIVELHGAARDRHFAEVEGLPGATGAATYHDQADFRPAQTSIGNVAGMPGPGLLQFAQVGPRQYCEPMLPRRQGEGLILVSHLALPRQKPEIYTSRHMVIARSSMRLAHMTASRRCGGRTWICNTRPVSHSGVRWWKLWRPRFATVRSGQAIAS